MRREDRENIPRGRETCVRVKIPVRCGRQTHEIHVLNNGCILFVSHNNWSAVTLAKEGVIHDKSKGCYAFIETLLSDKWKSGHFEFRYGGKTRRSGLSYLHKAGVGDLAGPVLAEMVTRRQQRMTSRNYHDEYVQPFHKVPAQRINRIYARIRNEQQEKLNRVMESLKKQGFDPIPGYWAMDYGFR